MASTRSWRSFFRASATAVFVVGASRRLRYANPAWERLTGTPWAKARGLRLSAFRSATGLGQALAPPAEVWAGATARVRRALPSAPGGPPWWDITFVPLPATAPDGEGGLLGVVGFLTQDGEVAPRRPGRPQGVKLPEGLAALQAEHAAHYTFELFTGTTEVGERFVSLLRLAATVAAPVWLVGERGSGKSTAARVLHHNGPTRGRAFAHVEAHGVQPYLLDALLFGKGGATLGADLGTLYLHDPGALPRDFQARLADYLSRPDGPRVLCASATPPAADARLVPGFAARFAVLEVRVPTLRERLDDLPWFAERVTPHAVHEDAWPVLGAHDWPGNLRELAGVLRAAACRAAGAPVGAEHLPRVLRERHLLAANPLAAPGRTMALASVLQAVERRMIEDALRHCGGNLAAAAKRLDLPRATLLRRVEALNVPRFDGGQP